jgi:hypothetical protein
MIEVDTLSGTVEPGAFDVDTEGYDTPTDLASAIPES